MRINVYRFDPPIHSTRDDLPGHSRFEHTDETWCPLHVRYPDVRQSEAVLHQESVVHHGRGSADAVRIVAGRISRSLGAVHAEEGVDRIVLEHQLPPTKGKVLVVFSLSPPNQLAIVNILVLYSPMNRFQAAATYREPWIRARRKLVSMPFPR